MPGTRRRATGGTPYRVLLLVVVTLALITTAEHYASMQMSAVDPSWLTVGHALKSELPRWGVWLLVVPPALWIIRRTSWHGWRIVPTVLLHVGLATLCIIAHKAVLLAIHRLIGFPTGERPFWDAFRARLSLGDLPGSLLGYMAAIGAALSIDYYIRYRERDLAAAALDRELAEARLAALQSQLNPHFLFNALNSVSMLVRQNQGQQAVDMIARLSRVLRDTLDEKQRHEVTLGEELDQVSRFLEIERIRFADRLSVSVDVPDPLRSALVPTLILQPLVENAIRHGVARSDGGMVGIAAQQAGADLVIEVRDSGPGLAGSGVSSKGQGIGLRNTRARLAALYGDRGRLSLENGSSHGTTARVAIPFRNALAGA